MKSANFRYFFVAIFLMLPAAAYSQGSETTYPSAPSPARDHLGDDSNFVVSRSVSGAIIGLKDGILTLRTVKNKEVRIALHKETRYRLGKKTLDPNELEEGMFADGRPVRITYRPLNHRLIDKVAIEVRFEEIKGKEPKKPEITS